MGISNLHDLFVHTLEDILFAESLILKQLPRMAGKASSSQLRAALEKHAVETEEHIRRLEKVFASIGESAEAEECPAIEGLTEEAKELIAEIEDPETRDAALLAAVQAVEHYEITRYGTLAAWADELGHREAVGLLQRTLDEERATDAALSELAENRLNRQAAA